MTLSTEAARAAYTRVSAATAIPIDVLTGESRLTEHRHARYLFMAEMKRAGGDISAIAKRMALRPDTVKAGLARVEGLIQRDFDIAYVAAQLRLAA